jgi:hypothetical protein
MEGDLNREIRNLEMGPVGIRPGPQPKLACRQSSHYSEQRKRSPFHEGGGQAVFPDALISTVIIIGLIRRIPWKDHCIFLATARDSAKAMGA